MAPEYAELHALSNYTFLRGASYPEELVERAHELGYRALAITDECSVSGVARAHIAAKSIDFPIIIGSEVRLDDQLGLVILARSRQGYRQLCSLITLARRNAVKGDYRITREQLQALDTSDCALLYLPLDTQYHDLPWLKEYAGGRLWLTAERSLQAGEKPNLERLASLSRRYDVPVVANGNVHMHERGRRMMRDVLDAIRHGCRVSELGYRGHMNAEYYLRSRHYLARLFPEKWLQQSIRISEQCRFSLDELRYEYPPELVPDGYRAIDWLRHLALDGARQRWPDGIPETAAKQLEHEFQLIEELGFEHYFLTVADIVRFAQQAEILHQGRGSAANSAVCYCLRITEIDPARMSLLFERFVSRERKEPPDIDVDFEHERREEVIQYIYNKYGRHRAALAATVVTYRTKSALRDVGKALGIPLDKIERVGVYGRWRGRKGLEPEAIQQLGLCDQQHTVRQWLDISKQLIGFPRHLSQHVGGFVIAKDDLSGLVPVENAAMPERTVIQWEKDDLEALGLLKVDVLALGMLSMLRRALGYLSQQTGRQWSLSDIESGDKPTYAAIQRADTIGVFQIESRAQMSMLPRLRPKNFYDLVIQIAIVRPGPIQGDMVHPYLCRRNGIEPVSYASKAVEKTLKRTLGVPIFQEQVMQLSIDAAGFTPGEADQLRRGMAAWKRKGGMEKFERKLIDGMTGNGYSLEFAQRIFNQVKGFGEYGFPESHSASFALLAYTSAWFKCHHPAIFLCALLNSQPMGFYAPAQLIYDARRHDVEVRPVDIRFSDRESTMVRRKQGGVAVRLGLRLARGLSSPGIERILELRARLSTQNKTLMVNDLRAEGFSCKDLQALAAANALLGVSGHRHQAVWDVSDLPLQDDMLKNACQPDTATVLLRKPGIGEEVLKDYRSTGFSLQSHPLALLRDAFRMLGWKSSYECRNSRDGAHICTTGLVIGRQRPGTASGVVFVSLEDEYGILNTIVWPDIAEKYRQALLSARLLLVKGKLQLQQDVLHLVAAYLEDCSHYLNELPVASRDFH